MFEPLFVLLFLLLLLLLLFKSKILHRQLPYLCTLFLLLLALCVWFSHRFSWLFMSSFERCGFDFVYSVQRSIRDVCEENGAKSTINEWTEWVNINDFPGSWCVYAKKYMHTHTHDANWSLAEWYFKLTWSFQLERITIGWRGAPRTHTPILGIVSVCICVT